MNEQQLIQDAASDLIKQIFKVFFDAYTAALGNAAGEQKAEATFQAGILHVRYVRDRAIAILPP